MVDLVNANSSLRCRLILLWSATMQFAPSLFVYIWEGGQGKRTIRETEPSENTHHDVFLSKKVRMENISYTRDIVPRTTTKKEKTRCRPFLHMYSERMTASPTPLNKTHIVFHNVPLIRHLPGRPVLFFTCTIFWGWSSNFLF